jgi:DNA-binding SARP family transcriptional activator
MKKLLIFCKLINNWTNNHITAKEEAEQILKFMLLKNNTQRVIQVYEELERLTALEMDKRAFESLKTSKLIQSKWGKESIVKHPDFDLPLNQINVDYESIN